MELFKVEKFWSLVNKDGPIPPLQPELGPCWIWTGHVFEKGYGNFFDQKHWRAHRYSWMLHFGVIPKDILVCHQCDNPPCVNPAHLFLGTPRKNSEDMLLKNRSAKGEEHSHAKHTKSDILKVRELWGNGASQLEISQLFGMTQANVWMIVHRRSWKHI